MYSSPWPVHVGFCHHFMSISDIIILNPLTVHISTFFLNHWTNLSTNDTWLVLNILCGFCFIWKSKTAVLARPIMLSDISKTFPESTYVRDLLYGRNIPYMT
jgi:hypothetical protein